MKTIFNTYIEIESQEQADRLKKVCINNGLAYWKDFKFIKNKREYRFFECHCGDFCNWLEASKNHTQVTETEWMQLLKEYKL